MATRHSREHLNPLKKKFVSPNANRKSPKFPNISPKFKSNLKEFHKFPQQGKKDGNLKKKLYEMRKEKRERYHLGGNSSDPLNLNSLINRDPMLNTPQASPHPTHGDSPIDVCLPHHDNDPLNLKCFPDEDLKEGVTPKKKKKKKHKHNDIENKADKDENKVEQSKKKKKKNKKAKATTQNKSVDDNSVKEEHELQENLLEGTDIKERKTEEKSETSESSDSEPPSKKKRKSSNSSVEESSANDSAKAKTAQKVEELIEEKHSKEESTTAANLNNSKHNKEQSYFRESNKPKNKKAKVFIYGNYNRYYNYRNPHCSEDLRLKTFSRAWFVGKDVLDIGCNVGDITIFIAKQFEPRIIIGNDIDNALVKIAKNKCQSFAQRSACTASSFGQMKFPMSFAVTNGPIAVAKLLEKEANLKFPNNVVFKQENYVPPDDKCLFNQKPMYDTILCLSVTKWVHLNWGDQGLKRMFKKIYKNLRPGGRLILEPQPFASYKKRRKLTEKIRSNYENISFRPEQFIDYLLSDEVGFVAYEVLEEPQHGVPGFRRPIYLLTKANTSKS